MKTRKPIMTPLLILRFLLTASLAVLVASCDRGSNPGQSDSKADARMEKLTGVWQGQSKLIGGQGLAEVKIELKNDRTFVMDIVAAERAHALNAYPTLDRIRMAGKWSMDEDRKIPLDGKIEEFLRTVEIGDAARHGFLPDDTKGMSETRLVPLPFEYEPSLRVSQDGTIHLDSIEFRGRKTDDSDDRAWSRMVINVPLERAAD